MRRRAGARCGHPVRARADDDVCRVARHRAPGHRVARGGGGAAPGAGQGHLRGARRGCSRTCTSPRSPRTCAGAGRPRRPGWSGWPRSSRRPRRRPGSGSRPASGPGGSSGCGWPPVSRWRSRPAGTRPTLLPGLDRHDLGRSLYELFAGEYGRSVDTADQTVRAELADASTAHHLAIEPGDPVLVFDRRSRSGGAPLERVTSHYRGDRYELHVSLDRTMPDEAHRPPRRGPHDHRRRHGRGGREEAPQPRAHPEVRPQPDAADRRAAGRSAHAAPRPARPARRRRPGLGQGRRRPGRRRRSPVREPAAAVRRRCRHRHGEEGRRLDGARRGGRLPRLQGRGGCRVAVRAPVTAAGGGPGADQLRRARRHPVRADRRLPLAALLPHLAAALPGVLRRPPLRADRHRVRDAHPGRAAGGHLPGLRRRPDQRRRVGRRERRSSAGSSTAPPTGC